MGFHRGWCQLGDAQQGMESFSGLREWFERSSALVLPLSGQLCSTPSSPSASKASASPIVNTERGQYTRVAADGPRYNSKGTFIPFPFPAACSDTPRHCCNSESCKRNSRVPRWKTAVCVTLAPTAHCSQCTERRAGRVSLNKSEQDSQNGLSDDRESDCCTVASPVPRYNLLLPYDARCLRSIKGRIAFTETKHGVSEREESRRDSRIWENRRFADRVFDGALGRSQAQRNRPRVEDYSTAAR